MIELYEHQAEALRQTENFSRVAYYHDMGLGKTFTGAEKMMRLDARANLVVCQKSKVDDWLDHFDLYSESYHNYNLIYDLTEKNAFDAFMDVVFDSEYTQRIIGVINYDLVFRRPRLKELKDFTLMLDESSLIQNEKAKRTKFIMSMQPKNVILLSGTPTGGKYERLLTQMNLLGWKISENTFWNQYVDWEWNETEDGFWQKKILGYKNEERLRRKMRQHGCQFLKTEEVFDLPEKIDQKIRITASAEYHKFKKHSYLELDGRELMGDTTLNKMLYERQLCGQYCDDKLTAFDDLLNSTEDRLIVFYNFWDEFDKLCEIAKKYERNISVVNGEQKDLSAYDGDNSSITFVNYQAGAMGLNLQKANRIIYFTPPLSSELFEQSKKRIHRIGQKKPCYYYYLICRGSVEEKIYRTLAMRKDYTEKLFEEG